MVKTIEKLEKAEKRVKNVLKELETLSTSKETINANIKCEESLSAGSEFELPLYVHGDMIGVGQHKARYYTPEELVMAVKRFNKMAFKLDHLRDRAGSTVGAIDKLVWNPEKQVVEYEGHINDETHARNIIDGVVSQVSVTSEANNVQHPLFGIIATDIDFLELSLVEAGKYANNSINVGRLT